MQGIKAEHSGRGNLLQTFGLLARKFWTSRGCPTGHSNQSWTAAAATTNSSQKKRRGPGRASSCCTAKMTRPPAPRSNSTATAAPSTSTSSWRGRGAPWSTRRRRRRDRAAPGRRCSGRRRRRRLHLLDAILERVRRHAAHELGEEIEERVPGRLVLERAVLAADERGAGVESGDESRHLRERVGLLGKRANLWTSPGHPWK